MHSSCERPPRSCSRPSRCVSVVVHRFSLMSLLLSTIPQLATNISELVQKGIREAEEQLQREMGAQKGLMRKIPVVGPLLNWWSPAAPSVSGRAFDLASSQVQAIKKVRFSWSQQH